MRDMTRVQRMLRWFDKRVENRYQRRRRHGRGGGGGSGGRLAFCKEDAPASDEIICYLDDDLEPYSSTTTYNAGEWVEDAGLEYRSLVDGNLGHPVTDPIWWEEGTHSVTVQCNISNASTLDESTPLLVNGAPITVIKIGDDWTCTDQFNGAAVRA